MFKTRIRTAADIYISATLASAMDADDLDLVLVGNEPSMSVVSSLLEHPQPLGTATAIEVERHTFPTNPTLCTGSSGNCVWHTSALNAKPAHTQHSTSLQNGDTHQLIGEWDGKLPSKVKRDDEGESAPNPKENTTPTGFPQPLELSHRGKDCPRDSEDYGPPPPVISLTPIYEAMEY